MHIDDAPRVVRWAGIAIGVEGVVGIVVAVVLLIRGLAGADESVTNGWATAVWFLIVGAAVAAGGLALWAGRRWGRGLGVIAQLVLLPTGYLIAVEHPQYGVPILVVAVVVLVVLFSPPTLHWVTASRDANAPEPTLKKPEPKKSQARGPATDGASKSAPAAKRQKRSR